MEKITPPVTAYIGLGANLGDREKNLREALRRMDEVPGVRVRKVSAFRRTAPLGPLPQPSYLNAVAAIETTLDPLTLLDCLQAIETRMGRVRRERWGPRPIDLDILRYDECVLSHPRLTLPHPELQNREFFLQGLAEVAS